MLQVRKRKLKQRAGRFNRIWGGSHENFKTEFAVHGCNDRCRICTCTDSYTFNSCTCTIVSTRRTCLLGNIKTERLLSLVEQFGYQKGLGKINELSRF